MTIKPKLL